MANLSNWYESKSLVCQKLVDMICNKTSYVINEKEIDRFLLLLQGYGINTAKQFEHSFFAEYKGDEVSILWMFVQDWSALAKGCSAKQLLKDRSPELLWRELIHLDFHRFVFNENTYFLKKNFHDL